MAAAGGLCTNVTYIKLVMADELPVQGTVLTCENMRPTAETKSALRGAEFVTIAGVMQRRNCDNFAGRTVRTTATSAPELPVAASGTLKGS